MNVRTRGQQPESWDEAPDLRRFWWLALPLAISLTVSAVFVVLSRSAEEEPVVRVVAASSQNEHRVPLLPGGLIRVQNDRGAIRVEPGPPGRATVVIERVAVATTTSAATVLLDRVLPQFSSDDANATLVVADAGNSASSVTTEIRITVPPGTRVEAQTLRGDITILAGDGMQVLAATANGHVRVDVDGELSLDVRVAAHELATGLTFDRVSAEDGETWFVRQESQAADVALEVIAPAGRVTLLRE